MKKTIAIFLLAALMLSACADKTVPASAEPEQEVQTTQAEAPETQSAETEAPETQPAPEYPGVYEQVWSEEIGGAVVELHSYIVLNEDSTGYWIAQDIGMLTWDENRLMLTIGAEYEIALAQENGSVNLLIYEFQDENGEWIPTVFEKIDRLPEQIEQMLAQP